MLITNVLSKRNGIKLMSAQAIGNAIVHNKISIIVPCHMVVGNNNNLTGYVGGINKKIDFLKLEKSYKNEFFITKRNKDSKR